MLAPEPFFEPRGTPFSVYGRVQLLSRLGHEVHLLTYHVGRDIDLPGLTIHRIPRLGFISRVAAGPSWAKPLLDALLFLLAVKHLLTTNYDVIHTHEEAAMLAMPLAGLFRKPHIYDMHSSLPAQLKNFRFANWRLLVQAFTLLERWVLKTCSAVITVGADLEAYVRRIHPAAKQIRLENLPLQANGFHADPEAVAALRARFGLAERFCVVYTGTLEAYQGLDLLLDSAKLVAGRDAQALFIWVGGQPHQVEYWQAQVKAANLQDRLLLVGAAAPAESLAYLEAADVLVSPRRDGTSVPLKIYTYLQAGKPVIATRSWAHTQVVNEQTALLVDPTPEAFADGILRLAGDAQLRQTLADQASAYASQKFRFEDRLETLAGLYQAVALPAKRASAPTLGT